MMNDYDLEELLEEKPVEKTWGFPKRVAVVLGAVGLVALALLSVKGKTLRSKSGEFVKLEETSCFEWGQYYANPTKMAGTDRSVELNAEACQQRCQVTEACAYFTFWPDGGCLLTGDSSTPKVAPAKYSATVYGPKFCPEAIGAAVQQIDNAAAGQLVDGSEALPDGASGLVAGSSGLVGGSSGLVGGSSGLVGDATPSLITTIVPLVPLGAQAQASWTNSEADKIAIAAGDITEMLPGVNGTSCSAYPACVAAGMTGSCCPNDEKVALGCCNGFPKTAIELPVIAVGAACSSFPACVALNITGACCPSPDGIQLGCCSQII